MELWFTAAMALILLGFCAATVIHGFVDSDHLWRDVRHDRNSHFRNGLDLALALRSFDPLGALALLERAKVWPPVHDVVLATVLLIGGPDHRLGMLPSLVGWAATVMLVGLIACRLFTDPIDRVTAGAVAVTFALASPAFRLLGADVMLEGLGAALTALSLIAYLRCETAPNDARRWRFLALTLTLLFFEKGNYWGLTAVPLALAYAYDHRGTWLPQVPTRIAQSLRFVARHAWRDPLILACLVVTAAVLAIFAHGPLAVELFGHDVSLYPPGNLTTVAYALLFWRGVLAWRRHRAVVDTRLGIAGRALFYWHVVPVAASFLLPKRLSTFLWFVGPNNAPGTAHYNPWVAAQVQWMGFAEGFHVAPWAGLLALILAGVGAGSLPRLAPGARSIAVLLLLSAAAVVLHPQQQWRFQASWLFALWICSGVGAAMLLGRAASRLPARLRLSANAAAVALLAVAQAAAPISATAYMAAIQRRDGPSDLELAAAYLPFTDGSEPVAFLSSLNRNDFVRWTVRERCRCRAVVEQLWIDQAKSRDQARRLVADWIATTSVRRIVVIDAPDTYPNAVMASERMAGIRDAMQSQVRFASGAKIAVPSFPAEVTIWQLRDAAGTP